MQMITTLKKMFAIAGLSALLAGSVLGNYSHFISSNQQFDDGYVSVPTAGTCTQVAAVYGTWDSAIINGPLGYYIVSMGHPVSLNNVPISAGSYHVYGSVTGSGYCGCQITW